MRSSSMLVRYEVVLRVDLWFGEEASIRAADRRTSIFNRAAAA